MDEPEDYAGREEHVDDVLNQPGLQYNVQQWLHECFDYKIIHSRQERALRFLEESLELCQAAGLPFDSAKSIAQYVYSRPVGRLEQEAGGVMIALAALCNNLNIDMDFVASAEYDRICTKVEAIRAKQIRKGGYKNITGAYTDEDDARYLEREPNRIIARLEGTSRNAPDSMQDDRIRGKVEEHIFLCVQCGWWYERCDEAEVPDDRDDMPTPICMECHEDMYDYD